ncbi:hypothetical protein THTE_2822 [Thermogutta terrifontis]|uniref:Uncharacterized protein n=1 Tax=Thermogutta terrifontis TaxID=1331910 RepID=A0A286RHH0_9BACT|nr:hypothetical protein THTE_2822 [Thermogutta terrifontis]
MMARIAPGRAPRPDRANRVRARTVENLIYTMMLHGFPGANKNFWSVGFASLVG